MAILGFLAHALPGYAPEVEGKLGSMPEITTYGIQNKDYVVAVAEAPAQVMQPITDRVKAFDEVISVYVTSFSTEDEEM